MGCNCGKPKRDGQCGCKSPAVLQINNPPEYITFHKVSVPAVMGDSTTNPPAVGKYKNVLLFYEADQTSWLYSTDGIPTKLTNGITNYEDAINLPQINGHTLLGNQSSSDLGLQGELTAGANIQINDNVISATDTTYTAGNGIELDGTEIKAKIGDGLEFDGNGEIDIADIEQYAHFFDTVASMKNATNLINGSYAKTLGFHAKNDGGGATYKIRNVTNDDVIDGASIIEMNDVGNQLVAELILTDPINVKTFGAYGDYIHDDTQAIQKAINYGFSKGIYTTFLPAGEYKTTDPIYLLEKCEICGENYSSSIIHKASHGTGSISGLNADAVIILADSTHATGSTVSTDVRNNEKINNLTIQGCVEAYEAGKTDANKQYGIWCIGYAPKTHIDKLWIRRTDVGVKVVGMYVSHIRDCLISTWYSGIRVTNECQGLTVANINTVANHEIGIELSGATYGSIQSCLVELTYNSVAYKFTDWHGDMTGCGTELGDGANVGINALRSKVRITGGYFYTPTGAEQDNNTMLVANASTITVSNSVFGSYDMTSSFRGKFANIYNGNIIVDESNKFLCTYTEDSVGNGYAFLTICGKTIDLTRDITSLQSGIKTFGDKYKYLDYDISPTKKHHRSDIYFGNINNAYTNENGTSNLYGPAYNKGDIGFFKNARALGRLGWLCNRDNKVDIPTSAGTISNVTTSSITLTDPFPENYSTTGVMFYIGCKVTGVTSGATARITWYDDSNAFGISEKTGTFQVGEKIKMVSEDFWTNSDYLGIPLILWGPSNYRPSTNVTIGTMYFDTTLNKPIWYKGSNTWVDATGTTV